MPTQRHVPNIKYNVYSNNNQNLTFHQSHKVLFKMVDYQNRCPKME